MPRIISEAYKAWRLAVFRRDEFKCQMPGCAKKGKIYAHHIKRWAENPALRHAITNGITLCHGCHGKVYQHETEYEAQFFAIVSSKSEDAIGILVGKYAKRKE